MEKEYWQGRVDEKFDWNDKEHKRIFDAVEKIGTTVETLKTRAARWGALGGILVAIGAYLATLLINHLCR